MTCAEAIRAYIATLSPVTAFVSGRIFSPYLPQQPEPAKLPCVLVQQISDVQDLHLRGTADIKEARIQIDCVGNSFSEARSVDQAVQGGYQSGDPTGIRALGGVSQGGITFHRIRPQNYFELNNDGELRYQKRVVRDYLVAYSG